jgi:hypothetical protein
MLGKTARATCQSQQVYTQESGMDRPIYPNLYPTEGITRCCFHGETTDRTLEEVLVWSHELWGLRSRLSTARQDRMDQQRHSDRIEPLEATALHYQLMRKAKPKRLYLRRHEDNWASKTRFWSRNRRHAGAPRIGEIWGVSYDSAPKFQRLERDANLIKGPGSFIKCLLNASRLYGKLLKKVFLHLWRGDIIVGH